jgi:hypothetical protein
MTLQKISLETRYLLNPWILMTRCGNGNSHAIYIRAEKSK